jgi:hypothetical protein
MEVYLSATYGEHRGAARHGPSADFERTTYGLAPLGLCVFISTWGGFYF